MQLVTVSNSIKSKFTTINLLSHKWFIEFNIKMLIDNINYYRVL